MAPSNCHQQSWANCCSNTSRTSIFQDRCTVWFFLQGFKMFSFDSLSNKLSDYIIESYYWMDHGGSFFFVQLSWNIIEHDLLVKWRGHTVIVLPGADLITGMILTGINWGVEDRGLVSLFGFSLSFSASCQRLIKTLVTSRD